MDELLAARSAVVRLQDALLKRISQRWDHHGLTLAQIRLFIALRHEGSIGMNELAHSLGIGAPTTSALVDSMVKKGWVDRREDAADRRRTLVQLTEEGEALSTHRPGQRGRFTQWFQSLSAEELAATVAVIDKLTELMGAEKEDS
jgi:DNA-binding MarR family transcriptional regulator